MEKQRFIDLVLFVDAEERGQLTGVFQVVVQILIMFHPFVTGG